MQKLQQGLQKDAKNIAFVLKLANYVKETVPNFAIFGNITQVDFCKIHFFFCTKNS